MYVIIEQGLPSSKCKLPPPNLLGSHTSFFYISTVGFFPFYYPCQLFCFGMRVF